MRFLLSDTPQYPKRFLYNTNCLGLRCGAAMWCGDVVRRCGAAMWCKSLVKVEFHVFEKVAFL
jgi:hypothetical protein